MQDRSHTTFRSPHPTELSVDANSVDSIPLDGKEVQMNRVLRD
jgi:hypothetical protein